MCNCATGGIILSDVYCCADLMCISEGTQNNQCTVVLFYYMVYHGSSLASGHATQCLLRHCWTMTACKHVATRVEIPGSEDRTRQQESPE